VKFALVLHETKWWQCLDDLRRCLGSALTNAGHEVDYASDWQGAPTNRLEIVIGAHRESVTLPSYPVVIYQTEVPGSGSFPQSFAEKLKRALCVWDSAPNYGTGDAIVEPGLMQVSAPIVEKDIDLLFYGSLSQRRVELLTKLQDAGLAPSCHFNLFGYERNVLIDRAKVIVDIKQRAEDPNDKTRTFFLDSRGACVLTENDEDDRRRLRAGSIVQQCRELLANPELRRVHAASRRAELKPVDVSGCIAALERRLAKPANGRAAHHHV